MKKQKQRIKAEINSADDKKEFFLSSPLLLLLRLTCHQFWRVRLLFFPSCHLITFDLSNVCLEYFSPTLSRSSLSKLRDILSVVIRCVLVFLSSSPSDRSMKRCCYSSVKSSSSIISMQAYALRTSVSHWSATNEREIYLHMIVKWWSHLVLYPYEWQYIRPFLFAHWTLSAKPWIDMFNISRCPQYLLF